MIKDGTKDLVKDFAVTLKTGDSRAPQFTSRSGRAYQPGIGPHIEGRGVGLIVDEFRWAVPSHAPSPRLLAPRAAQDK
jgi:hypothetical protein